MRIALALGLTLACLGPAGLAVAEPPGTLTIPVSPVAAVVYVDGRPVSPLHLIKLTAGCANSMTIRLAPRPEPR